MTVLLTYLVFALILIKAEAYDVISSSTFGSCNHSSYFDSLSHKCKNCGIFQKASDDRLSCVCDIGYIPEVSEKSKTTECVRCDQSTQSETCLKTNLTCESYAIKGYINAIKNCSYFTIVLN